MKKREPSAKERSRILKPDEKTPKASAATGKVEGKRVQAEDRPPEPQATESTLFPIVGIGASAGGLEAFTQLLSHLPNNPGMALVFVQHLAPQHESALSELLGRATRTIVTEVKDDMAVERDRIYVIPPNTNMAIQKGHLRLVPRTPDQRHLPIDYFLRSLAEELGGRAIGVILSGTASDGTLGLKAIKTEGGITFAQDARSARYADMPRNAVAAGCVDFVLSPEGIARELVRIAHHPYLLEPRPFEEGGEMPAEGEEHLRRIFTLLRSASGVDFTHYKHTTIKRRIKRRMVLLKLQSFRDYVSYLEEHRAELDALYQDILIHVTGFFRDPVVFEALKTKVFPVLMQDRRPGAPIRIWVPGCSTGEEAYSIAICLMEYLGDTAGTQEIQIFATDISDAALERARAGLYMENIAAEVSPERLRRFFIKTPNGYQIIKSMRDKFVFARQDVSKDPPFSRLDLISCRNLLIYLGAFLQKHIIPVFHYALRPTGFLLLGSSETIGAFADHFTLLDKKNKIYAKRATTLRLPLEFSGMSEYDAGRIARKGVYEEPTPGFDMQKEADRILLSRFAPAGVIVNSDYEIVQFRGRTGPFLEPTPGQASLSLLRMAREGLLVDLRGALQKAKKNDAIVKKEGVEVRSNGGTHDVDIEVIPLRGPTPAERYYLVLFQASKPETQPEKVKLPAARVRLKAERGSQRQLSQLRHELTQTKSTLQSVIEEQDTTTEELKSANEEILSSNEELQSTNEELETAKEELQSTNEELTTLNEELQNRNMELSVAHNDMLNLLASVNIPILMLGNDLRVRRFTPLAEKLLNLIPSDVGRPIGDIKPNFDLPEMEALITESIDAVTVKEQEVQDRQGHWYSMRIRPYRTSENKLDGAVITWVDVSALKASLQQSEARLQLLVDSVHDYAIFMLDPGGRVTSWNSGSERIHGYQASEILGKQFSCFFPEGDRRAGKPQRVLETAAREGRFEEEGRRVRKDGSEFWASVVITAVHGDNGHLIGFTKVVRDITDRMRARLRLEESEKSLRELTLDLLRIQDEERRHIGRELHDTVGQYLSSLKLKLEMLQNAKSRSASRIGAEIEECTRLAEESLSELRTASYLLYPPMLDEMGLSQSVAWYVEGFQRRSGIETRLEMEDGFPRLSREAEIAVYRVLQEGLTNVHRHSGSRDARIRLAIEDGSAVLHVSDSGKGIPSDGSAAPPQMGVGLRGMGERLRQLGGSLELSSTGTGTTLTAAVPIQTNPRADGSGA